MRTTITGRVVEIVRLRSSNSGNPRWKIITDHGAYTTQSDTGDAFKVVGNETGMDVTLDLDHDGQAYGIEFS